MSSDAKGHLLLSMAVSLILLCVACWSCSVLEDRDDCPCLLVLDLGVLRGQDRFPVTLAVSGQGGFFYTDTLWREDSRFDYYLEVPRGETVIYAVNAAGAFFVPGYGLKITSGAQCPKVWMSVRRLNLGAERCRDTLRLSKNYCLLDIRISESGNKTLGLSLELLEQEITRDEIVRTLSDRFESEDGEIENDVDSVLKRLREIGAVDD